MVPDFGRPLTWRGCSPCRSSDEDVKIFKTWTAADRDQSQHSVSCGYRQKMGGSSRKSRENAMMLFVEDLDCRGANDWLGAKPNLAVSPGRLDTDVLGAGAGAVQRGSTLQQVELHCNRHCSTLKA